MKTLDLDSKIYVAGHRGLVGGAIKKRLKLAGYRNIITQTHHELDLRNQHMVDAFFKKEKPEFVFLAAAKVGGIHANNKFRGDFILENLQIQTNVITASFHHDVEKLLFMGSSCIYPKYAPQPIPESALLTGSLEPTNEAYAVAKIAGLMLCKSLLKQYGRRFISVMPTNVYGPGDRYDLEGSHVLPALVIRFHGARVREEPHVSAWGTGTPRREFIHCDDLADASLFCMQHYEDAEHINLGTGQEVSIAELTQLVRNVVGYRGEILWDITKPDGTPRKLLDSTKLKKLGWAPKITLEEGLKTAYEDYLLRFGVR